MQLSRGPLQKSFKLHDLTSPRSKFWLLPWNFLFIIFSQPFLKKWNVDFFEHLIFSNKILETKTKTKCKLLLLAAVVHGGMLIQIKTFTSFETLGGDRFGDSLKLVEQLQNTFKAQKEKLQRKKKLRNYIIY